MTDPRQPLTACVITLDEEHNLEACLESVSFCDDVVLVDAGSRDATVAVARRLGARVFERAWPGFVEQKNFALEQARHDWVLSVDADERVTPELRAAIERELRGDPTVSGFRMRRLSRYLGRWIRHGSWYPDVKLRLFRRSRGGWTGGRVHEHVRVEGPVGELEGYLHHHPFRDLADHVRTINRYTTLVARDKHERGPRVVWPRVILSGPLKFLKMYVLQRGFLDGWPGFVCCVMGAHYEMLKYAKLWELQRNATAQP